VPIVGERRLSSQGGGVTFQKTHKQKKQKGGRYTQKIQMSKRERRVGLCKRQQERTRMETDAAYQYTARVAKLKGEEEWSKERYGEGSSEGIRLGLRPKKPEIRNGQYSYIVSKAGY